MAQYLDIFEELGLAKNEGRIYETLLYEGESGVGSIATRSGVHRRNVYDSLQRLIERGLVFERITSTEHRYQATDPRKLVELVKEKEEKIQAVLPDLEKLYRSVPHTDDVVVYRGIEGWKNYMRDIIRIGKDVYTIGAKGTWQDARLSHVVAQTAREAKKKGIVLYALFDPEIPMDTMEQWGFTLHYRFLPSSYDTTSTIEIFGDHVVLISNATPGAVIEDRSLVTIINQQTADAFRTWFDLLWMASTPAGEVKKASKKK